LTGDPKFRQNLLQLVNGLSKLVSSSKDVQEQTKVAVTLDSLKTSSEPTKVIITTPLPEKQVSVISPELKTPKNLETITQPETPEKPLDHGEDRRIDQ
ncbi:MAG: hypothetical protein ACKPGB_08705, partial [Dolichospermum sp.]